jgi:hypothetical protein
MSSFSKSRGSKIVWEGLLSADPSAALTNSAVSAKCTEQRPPPIIARRYVKLRQNSGSSKSVRVLDALLGALPLVLAPDKFISRRS